MMAIPYYVVMIIEAFILCYTGEYLSSKVRKRRRASLIIFSVINYYFDRLNDRPILILRLAFCSYKWNKVTNS